MKKLFFLSGFFLFALMACAQQPPASPRITAEGENVKVAYGQPSKKGRVIFGEKEKYGKVWRAGANEATEITFAKDGTFGDQPVKAGTYTLFVTPAENEWTVILNSSLKQWGSFKYDEIKDKDVLKVTVPTKKTDGVVEKLTYRFAGSDLIIEWDQTQVAVPVKFS